MFAAPLHVRFVEPAAHAHADESVLDPGRSDFLMLRAKGSPDIRLILRPARLSDGDALQSYVRGLSQQAHKPGVRRRPQGRACAR